MTMITDARRKELLMLPEGKKRVVIDTDTFNEIDDQFALVWALLSDEMDVGAIYAAPFFNSRSTSPKDGMLKSYDEIQRIQKLMDKTHIPVFHGSGSFMSEGYEAVENEASNDLITRAKEGLLYVIAIGCPVNVSYAITKAPEILNDLVIVWLGGTHRSRTFADEFNLGQDILSSRILFDKGAALVRVPCAGVSSHLQTTLYELSHYLDGQSSLEKYLLEIFKSYMDERLGWEPEDKYGWSKVLWDMAAVAYCIEPKWVPSEILPAPGISDEIKWIKPSDGYDIREVYAVDRDRILADFFKKVTSQRK